MTYSASLAGLRRHAAIYVDSIIEGAHRAPPRRAAHEVRAGDQPEDRQGAQPHDPPSLLLARGSGHRMTALLRGAAHVVARLPVLRVPCCIAPVRWHTRARTRTGAPHLGTGGYSRCVRGGVRRPRGRSSMRERPESCDCPPSHRREVFGDAHRAGADRAGQGHPERHPGRLHMDCFALIGSDRVRAPRRRCAGCAVRPTCSSPACSRTSA